MFREPSFWFDVRVYLALTTILVVIIAFLEKWLALIGVILLYVMYYFGRRRYSQREKALTRYLESVISNVDKATYYAMQELPMAIAIIDEAQQIHWRNHVFAEWFGEDAIEGQRVDVVCPAVDFASFHGTDGERLYECADRVFNVVHRGIITESDPAERFTLLFFTDVTEQEHLREEYDAEKLALAYVQFDNYSDVLKGMSDSQRATILAEVNKLVSVWTAELGGVVKHHADDLYFLVIDRATLDTIIMHKFDILDRMREIRAGNTIPLTFSIGIAVGEKNISALGQKAQACLDLSLGRGGDQATVSLFGDLQFFGGKSKALEKNTRVRARIVAQALHELITAADQVFVVGHANEDFDSIGSSIGMAKMAMHMKKPVHIVVSGRGGSLAKFNELLPDYKEYENLCMSGEEAVKLVTPDSLLFLVDHHRAVLTAYPPLLAMIKRRVVVDHHRRAEDFIEKPLLTYLEPAASSTSELVTELLQYFDDQMDFSRLEASVLYAGIVVDTKNFAVQTGARTFDAASFLRKAGADPTMVRQLFSQDFASMKLRARIVSSAEILPGGVIIAVCPAEIGANSVLAAQAADMMLSIEGIRVSIVIAQIGEEVVVSARSTGLINVQVLMEELGGGGHQTVAGVQLKGVELAALRQQIVELVNKYLEESDGYESDLVGRSEKSGEKR